MAVVARLDVILVRKFTAVIKISSRINDIPSNGIICSPSQLARPLVLNPSAIARRPPKSKNDTPDGSLIGNRQHQGLTEESILIFLRDVK
ncbi:MAG: hypothetical protein ACJATN_001793 [Neolewinella sp.]|jgi:hypothetical protein